MSKIQVSRLFALYYPPTILNTLNLIVLFKRCLGRHKSYLHKVKLVSESMALLDFVKAVAFNASLN